MRSVGWVGLVPILVMLGFAGEEEEGFAGGTELIYELQLGPDQVAERRVEAAVDVVRKRLAAYGFDPVEVAPLPRNRFGLRVAQKHVKDLALLKRIVTDPGRLELRVTVEPDAKVHGICWKRFKEALEGKGDVEKARTVTPAMLPEAERVRYPHGLRWYPLSERLPKKYAAERLPPGEAWVLCELDPHNITAESLESVVARRDMVGLGESWVVHFGVKRPYRTRLAALTAFDAARDKYLAIIVNERVHAAPILLDTLSSAGQISGFDEAGTRLLAAVFAGGELPARPQLVAERPIGR